jgi:hypothetical protein
LSFCAAGTLADLKIESAIPLVIENFIDKPYIAVMILRDYGRVAIPHVLRAFSKSASVDVQSAGEQLIRELGGPDDLKQFAQLCSVEKDRMLQELGALSDSAIIDSLSALCRAYAANNRTIIQQDEGRATLIGEALHARGGIEEMRRVFEMLGHEPGTRTLEMHWDGIGDWHG